jgi:hypothetical protein
MTREPDIKYRSDLTCRKTGEPIPLDNFSISKWSDRLWLVYCPECRVMHEFEVALEPKP